MRSTKKKGKNRGSKIHPQIFVTMTMGDYGLLNRKSYQETLLKYEKKISLNSYIKYYKKNISFDLICGLLLSIVS